MMQSVFFLDYRHSSRKSYLAPGALWTEGVGAAGKETLAVAQQHLDVVVAILGRLSLVLARVYLFGTRWP